jgi:hypothetical protein
MKLATAAMVLLIKASHAFGLQTFENQDPAGPLEMKLFHSDDLDVTTSDDPLHPFLTKEASPTKFSDKFTVSSSSYFVAVTVGTPPVSMYLELHTSAAETMMEDT